MTSNLSVWLNSSESQDLMNNGEFFILVPTNVTTNFKIF